MLELLRFQVTLTLLECPRGRQDNNKQFMEFSTFDLGGKEDFKVNLNLVCDCNCTNEKTTLDTVIIIF